MKPLYKSEKVGDITVRTFDVALKKVYLTLAFENDRPFDLAVAESEEEAETNHAGFMQTAQVMDQVMPQLQEMMKGGEVPNREEIDAVVASFLPVPPGTLLN